MEVSTTILISQIWEIKNLRWPSAFAICFHTRKFIKIIESDCFTKNRMIFQKTNKILFRENERHVRNSVEVIWIRSISSPIRPNFYIHFERKWTCSFIFTHSSLCSYLTLNILKYNSGEFMSGTVRVDLGFRSLLEGPWN